MRFRRLLLLAAVGLSVWYVRQVHRYRDPVRLPGVQGGRVPEGHVLSPADGLVSFVRRVTGGQVQADALNAALDLRDLLGRDSVGWDSVNRDSVGRDPTGPTEKAANTDPQNGWLIGVVIGPLDVHYTYQPIAGEVTRVQHTGSRVNVALQDALGVARLLAGQPTDLLGTRATVENERLTITTRSAQGDITVSLVAPAAGLNATSYVRRGDQARAGYKSAFLAEGGLVLLLLPEALIPQVSVGDRVQGAETIIAKA